MKLLYISTTFFLEHNGRKYRRDLSGGWEQLLGESWESVFLNEKEIESIFQETVHKELLDRLALLDSLREV
jgi:hypothetical protein